MSEKETFEFLQNEPLLMRIGVIDTDGYPLVHPVWFIYEDEILACIRTQQHKGKDSEEE